MTSPPPPSRALPALAELGVASVHEALGRTGLLDPDIRPLAEGTRLAGTAVTVHLPAGDNLGLHQALDVIGAGDVLVVGSDADADGVFGELVALALTVRGARGVVVDTGCRDVAALRAMDLAVFCRCVSARGVAKQVPVPVNEPIVCAGVTVHPGDLVVGDDDGVVVVPAGRADEVVEAGRLRVELEAAGRAEIERGVSTLDLLGLRERIAGGD